MKAVACDASSSLPPARKAPTRPPAVRPIGQNMSDSQDDSGSGPGFECARRAIAAEHDEESRCLPEAASGRAPRRQMAEAGGFATARPPEPLARGAAAGGAGAGLGAERARGSTSPVDGSPFDGDTEERRELNRMAERVKAAYFNLGVTLAQYSPTRHTVYVCGRPVQADSVRGCTIQKPSGFPDIVHGLCTAGCGDDAGGRGHQCVQPSPRMALPPRAGHRGVHRHRGSGAADPLRRSELALVHGASA